MANWHESYEAYKFLFLISIPAAVIIFIFILSFASLFYEKEDDKTIKFITKQWHIVKKYNILALCFFYYWKWLILLIKRLIVLVGRFLRHVFVVIHSDERLLCFIYAAAGAGAGFWGHNPLLWALIGAILGVVNYEIVLKRVFKVVPGTTQ